MPKDQVRVILEARRRRARLVKLRADGATLAELARLEGCSRQFIWKILNRKSRGSVYAGVRPEPHKCRVCGFRYDSPRHAEKCGKSSR
jgi:predicted Zn-ribbon and HTH transcriptional regulator